MLTVPSDATPVTTELGTVRPAGKLTVEVLGREVSPGQTVRKPPLVALTAVMLRATEPTPVAGTPPVPRTVTFRVAPAPTAPPVLRVSRSRAGVRAWKPVLAGWVSVAAAAAPDCAEAPGWAMPMVVRARAARKAATRIPPRREEPRVMAGT